MKKIQQGFTLIELMIVVAIVGILAAVALPAYQDYTKRAHVAEGLGLAEAAKTGVTEFYADNNAWPTTNAEAGIDGNIVGNAVSSVTVGAGGQITIQYDAKVNSQTVLLIPADNGGSISWSCDTGTVDPKWRPARCR